MGPGHSSHCFDVQTTTEQPASRDEIRTWYVISDAVCYIRVITSGVISNSHLFFVIIDLSIYILVGLIKSQYVVLLQSIEIFQGLLFLHA